MAYLYMYMCTFANTSHVSDRRSVRPSLSSDQRKPSDNHVRGLKSDGESTLGDDEGDDLISDLLFEVHIKATACIFGFDGRIRGAWLRLSNRCLPALKMGLIASVHTSLTIPCVSRLIPVNARITIRLPQSESTVLPT